MAAIPQRYDPAFVPPRGAVALQGEWAEHIVALAAGAFEEVSEPDDIVGDQPHPVGNGSDSTAQVPSCLACGR